MSRRRRPRVLASNDDGIHAPGLAALVAALEAVGEVYVVAPDRERSAVGHALTLHRPLRVDRLGPRRFAVNGTPSDCVNLGVLGMLPARPDVVVAGVNAGSNLGDDVTYSGTVSAAMEGTLLGVPSLAVSQVEGRSGDDFRQAAEAGAALARMLLRDRERGVTLLNVNVPRGRSRGIRVARLGRRVYGAQVVERRDPRGGRYYWIGGGLPTWETGSDTDVAPVQAGYISVTPLHLDLTSYEGLSALKGWERGAAWNGLARGRAGRRG